MTVQNSTIRRVGIVGAGISGIVSAAHLLDAGFEVTVFERNKEAGGIWLHTRDVAIEAPYSCVSPSDIERNNNDERKGEKRQYLLHAPPGPCYDNLTNNIATPLMQTTLNAWPEGTPKVVNHRIVREYIQKTSDKVGVSSITIYGTSVTHIRKEASTWFVDWTLLQENARTGDFVTSQNTSTFDAIVIASGHYNSPRIPNITGLARAKSTWPERIMHSKSFRNAKGFEGKNVLLIGGGVSSIDIAKDVSTRAQTVYQSTRNGAFDMPASVLPNEVSRVSEVATIETAAAAQTSSTGHHPFTVRLKCNRTLHDIDKIIVCTGYQITLPFLPQYNDNSIPATAADDKVLGTDGGQVHNLHRDIFYIPDPTLVFVGLPLFNTTFTLFEFQARVIADVFSGIIQLPPTQAMREEYEDRVKAKGYGKLLHSLKDEEELYVNRLVEWMNDGRAERGLPLIEGHSASWKAERELVNERIRKMRAAKAAEKLGQAN